MKRWVEVGGVLLAVGSILLGVAAAGMDRTVVSEETVHTHLDFQATDNQHLARGDYGLWLEDHPVWPEEDWPREVYLRGEERRVDGDVPENPRFAEVEGVQCRLLAIFSNVPEGEWDVAIRFWDGEHIDVQDEVSVFLLKLPSSNVAVVLASGIILVSVGVWVVVSGKWKERAVAPPHHQEDVE